MEDCRKQNQQRDPEDGGMGILPMLSADWTPASGRHVTGLRSQRLDAWAGCPCHFQTPETLFPMLAHFHE
ncbi:MAG: hypothetical protein QE273_03325 [Verrucomicrobiales bacterium]|nr:hypothetical protein [Verrucomicrobiales bacterium]